MIKKNEKRIDVIKSVFEAAKRKEERKKTRHIYAIRKMVRLNSYC